MNLGRIRLFQAVNLERGYGLIEIRSPREVLDKAFRMGPSMRDLVNLGSSTEEDTATAIRHPNNALSSASERQDRASLTPDKRLREVAAKPGFASG